MRQPPKGKLFYQGEQIGEIESIAITFARISDAMPSIAEAEAGLRFAGKASGARVSVFSEPSETR